VKVSIILVHFKTWRWTAAAIHFFKTFPFACEHEVIVTDNSPGHPSIKCLTETDLGEGVKIVQGQADFPSHGKGYFHAYKEATGDWIFTAESDSFPLNPDWSLPYISAAEEFDFIAPIMPMAAGTYGHPAGALVNRKVLDQHQVWRESLKDWIFIPDAAPALGISPQGYHVAIRKDALQATATPQTKIWEDVALWAPDVGPWQEMRSFDDDDFATYGQRTGITNWEPQPDRRVHLRIGYEPGQHLWYFAKSHGVKCFEAPVHIEWMPGWEGRQAAYSDVFGGFRHVWCGTAAMGGATAPQVRDFKQKQADQYFLQLPNETRRKIEELEKLHA
jgi:hypothetical protein